MLVFSETCPRVPMSGWATRWSKLPTLTLRASSIVFNSSPSGFWTQRSAWLSSSRCQSIAPQPRRLQMLTGSWRPLRPRKWGTSGMSGSLVWQQIRSQVCGCLSTEDPGLQPHGRREAPGRVSKPELSAAVGLETWELLCTRVSGLVRPRWPGLHAPAEVLEAAPVVTPQVTLATREDPPGVQLLLLILLPPLVSEDPSRGLWQQRTGRVSPAHVRRRALGAATRAPGFRPCALKCECADCRNVKIR